MWSKFTGKVLAIHRQYWGVMAGRRVPPGIVPALCLLCGGCAGAPSFTLAGTYFPAWMLCAAIGIAAAISARALFVARGLNFVLPYQLLLCSSIGVIAGIFFWLILFAL
jgi:hypothetical protein